jgi:membrane-bound lytic murein transglycosylase B
MRSIKAFVRALSLAVATSFIGLLFGASTAQCGDYLSRPEVQSFIDSMSTEHGLDASELERVLGDAQYQSTVVRLIGPTPSSPVQGPRSYPAYRAKFLTKHRVAAGVRYWELNEHYLRQAEAEFGVPAEVILGILGVETAFGRNTGSFRVVDVLATIAFDGPRRQDYFRDELKELFLLAHERGVDPLSFKGSYAGAVGLPQFMPSSYRKLAVDFDDDGVIDLNGSPADAIGSVASYLSSYGWKPNEPATVPVRLPAGKQSELVSGLDRVYEIPALKRQGVRFTSARLPKGPCSVVELPVPGKPSKYVAGFGNFEAITRYNRSTFYATAVLDLADAIHSAHRQRLAARAEAHAKSPGEM